MAQIIERSGGGFSGTLFFTKSYDEAVGLVVEARNYFAPTTADASGGEPGTHGRGCALR
jgi:hypothetical protein